LESGDVERRPAFFLADELFSRRPILRQAIARRPFYRFSAWSDLKVATEYDAEIIREQADLLYAEADRAVLASMIILGILGVLTGGAAFYFLSDRNTALAIVLVLGIPIAGAVIGATLGEGRAFKLRSQAQQLLVLVAIETNTRKAVAPPPTYPASTPPTP
jgi:hypothetical protein